MIIRTKEELRAKKNSARVIAFDLDGTLTQHRSPLGKANREVLEKLSGKYRLLMVGAGQCRRIFNQLGEFPIDILGNYGLQFAIYNKEIGDIELKKDEVLPCDRESVSARIEYLRQKHGFTEYAGESVEFHPSGCVTFPILGKSAKIEDKLAFDPDRSRRRPIYPEVCELFPEYTVFVGGSSSFDFVPSPFDKKYALDRFCRENDIAPESIIYVGDDYGVGGNDEAVAKSDYAFVTIDDYTQLGEILAPLMEE